MIPYNGDYGEYEEEDELDFEMEREPSLTYAMNMDSLFFVGKVDDLQAVRQAVFKILNTERYEHEIYSWDYGVEFSDLFGSPMPYVMSEVKERIRDALMADDRIEAVEEMQVERIDKHTLNVTFTVVTTWGDEFETESEVEV